MSATDYDAQKFHEGRLAANQLEHRLVNRSLMLQLVNHDGVEVLLLPEKRSGVAGELLEGGEMRRFVAGRRRVQRGVNLGERGLELEDGVFEGTARGRSLRVHRPTSPSTGLLAVAYSFLGMRPDR